MWVAISLVLLLVIVSLSAILIGDSDENSDGDKSEEMSDSENYQLPGSPSSTYYSHPNVMSAQFTDLSMIEEISKFRSGAGHDFSNFNDDLPRGCDVNVGDYFNVGDLAAY